MELQEKVGQKHSEFRGGKEYIFLPLAICKTNNAYGLEAKP